MTLKISKQAEDAMDEARQAYDQLVARAALMTRAWTDEQRAELSIIFDMIHGTFNALNAIVSSNRG